MAPEARSEVLQIRLSPLEKRMLFELAENEELTAAEFVRHLVRTQHEAVFGARGRKKTAKKK